MHALSRAVVSRCTIAAVLAGIAILPAPCRAQAPAKRTAQGAWGGKTNGAGHYADVNGIKLYYEIHGTGRPLILLHGGLGAIEMFGPNLPALAKGRQLIAVDLQGHGRTADIDRALSVALMSDDIAALIKHLGLASADVMGYSLGGGVGLQGGGQRDGGWDGSGRPKSRLAILPGLTHYTIFNAPALAAVAIPFLDDPAR